MNDCKQLARENAKRLVEPILPIIGRVIEKAMQGVIEQACEMQLRVVELERQVEELRKDAGRYQQIRRGQKWSVINGIGDILRGPDLDAATDAGLGTSQEGERGMSDDQKATLLYMMVGTALDLGATRPEILRLFQQKNIDFAVQLIEKKEAEG